MDANADEDTKGVSVYRIIYYETSMRIVQTQEHD